jgi:hypothetical protein
MSFKENLKAKIKLDRILQSLVSTVREPPGRRWLDKLLTKKLLAMTDFEHKKARNLDLYIRPLEGEIVEVAVLDNELPIYHTTVDDVALRKSPYWQQMFSIGNVRKIMNDHDVIASKGKESLKRLHANAVSLLDLTCTRDDLALLLDVFVNLLDFQPLPLGVLEPRFQSFARPKVNGGGVPSFEHLILFDEEKVLIGLKKGAFSPQSDSDLRWVMRYVRGEETAVLQGIDVFEFLAGLAVVKAQAQKV